MRDRVLDVEKFEELRRRGRRLRRDDPLIRRILGKRPDLKDVFEKIPIRVVKEGEIGQVIGRTTSGLAIWAVREDGRAEPVEIIVEEPKSVSSCFERALVHEACHAKIVSKYPELYPYFSSETAERLAELCVDKKLPFSKVGADYQIEEEVADLAIKEGLREAFRDAMWRLAREKCDVADAETKEALNKAINIVLNKALEIEALDYADHEMLKDTAEKARNMCMEEKI